MLGLRLWELYVLLDRGSSTSFSTVYPISFLRTCGVFMGSKSYRMRATVDRWRYEGRVPHQWTVK
jgi:hypothetical protein